MGLGALLLDVDQTSARLRGGGVKPGMYTKAAPRARAATEAPRNGRAAAQVSAQFVPIQDFQLTEDAAQAKFVILWPALGCPELLAFETRELEFIFLSKEEESQVDAEKVRQMLPDILVLNLDEARQPYVQDNKPWSLLQMQKWTLASLVQEGSDSIVIRTKMVLADYKNSIKERPWQFGALLHSIADIVPEAYLHEGFKSIACARVKLKDNSQLAPEQRLEAGQMYNLFYGPENGVLRGILGSSAILKKPYDEIPLLTYQNSAFIGGHLSVYRWRHEPQEREDQQRYGDRKREHLVHFFHPFTFARTIQENAQEKSREFLNVGHITDLHTSSLWDFFDEKIFPRFSLDLAAFDAQGITTGRSPQSDADSRFTLAANRYNNPNLNARSLTQRLNRRAGDNYVDLILQTGDLIDFNRGFNFNPNHSPDSDYLFNLNWVRFYELLLLDYQRPTFTLLGNHDWRLNPYPPRIKAEAIHVLLLGYLLLTAAGAGASCGSVFGVLEKSKDGESSAVRALLILIQMVLAPFIAPLALFAFLFPLGGLGLDFDIATDVIFSKIGMAILLEGGWVLGFLIIWFLLFIKFLDQSAITDAADGTKWGTIVGGSIGLIAAIVGAFLIYKQRDYMTGITNLFGDDFKDLLDNKNVASLNAFGSDGVFYVTERSFDWYALVINPFPDYAFRFGNMYFMMADWGGSEILTGNPPIADDSLTPRQQKMLDFWIEAAINHREELRARGITASMKQLAPILGLHTPVFCPMIDKNLNALHNNETDIGDSDLTRGTMNVHRDELIKLFFELGQGKKAGTLEPIPAISLTGHTHTYDIFRMEAADKVKWYQREHFHPGFGDQGLHITTACAGPPSDDKVPDDNEREARQRAKPLLQDFDNRHDNTFDAGATATHYQAGQRVLRPAGCRVLTYHQTTGQLTKVEEVSAKTAKFGDAGEA